MKSFTHDKSVDKSTGTVTRNLNIFLPTLKVVLVVVVPIC